MVAIIKLILSAALLSHASCAVIQKRDGTSLQVDDPVLATRPAKKARPTANVLEVDDPVMATRTAEVALPAATTTTAAMADSTATSDSVANADTHDLELRRRLVVVSSLTSSSMSVLPTSTAVVVPTGILEVGEPVLATRVRMSTLTTKVRIAQATDVVDMGSAASVDAARVMGSII